MKPQVFPLARSLSAQVAGVRKTQFEEEVMKAKITLAGIILRAAVILGLVLSLVPAAGAQMPAVKAKSAPAKSQTATAAKPSGVPREGIKVHGHWTIVLRDAKGKEIERREFDNALMDAGKGLLAGLLSRQLTVGEWGVVLTDSSSTFIGVILEPASSNNLGIPVVSKTLAVTLVPAGGTSMAGTVQLKGDTRAIVAANITQVQTLIFTGQGGSGIFSAATLPSPINVAANQLIEVTVVLSFS
jgi:hypothetical protein